MSKRPQFTAVVVAALVCLAAVPSTLAGVGQWRTWWGQVAITNNVFTLSSQIPTAPNETHSALVTSQRSWGDQTFSFTTTTLVQLRQGSAPNPWEVGWVMFRFRDLQDYYWFMLKTNGFELGKKQGSDTQIFLVTGDSPKLVLGQKYRVQIQAVGANVKVFVNGALLVDYTDPHPLLSGSVGLYEEDSLVRFESVAVSGA